jgi:hypothetical protein
MLGRIQRRRQTYVYNMLHYLRAGPIIEYSFPSRAGILTGHPLSFSCEAINHQNARLELALHATLNPLFFQRHLEYRWASRRLRLFSSPSLPSASLNTIRLGLVNISERGVHVSRRGHSDVQALRTKGEDAMVRYLHNVNGEFDLHAGDSIVRAFQCSQRPILFH